MITQATETLWWDHFYTYLCIEFNTYQIFTTPIDTPPSPALCLDTTLMGRTLNVLSGVLEVHLHSVETLARELEADITHLRSFFSRPHDLASGEATFRELKGKRKLMGRAGHVLSLQYALFVQLKHEIAAEKETDTLSEYFHSIKERSQGGGTYGTDAA